MYKYYLGEVCEYEISIGGNNALFWVRIFRMGDVVERCLFETIEAAIGFINGYELGTGAKEFPTEYLKRGLKNNECYKKHNY